MKLDSGRSTDFLSLPAEEAERTIDAMKQAEQANDIEALKWCARRIAWLDDTSEIIGGDDGYHPAHIFNRAWNEQLKNDPAPDSIADIINRADEPEPVTASAAEKALDTVKAFFEESFAAALNSISTLRHTIEDTGDGE
jgi:hypothetical protein